MKALFSSSIMLSIYLLLSTANHSMQKPQKPLKFRGFMAMKSSHFRNFLISVTALVTVGGKSGLLLCAVILGVLYLLVPRLQERERNAAKRLTATELANVTEQIAMCLSVGMTTQQSLQFVSESNADGATHNLARTMRAIELGQPVPDALTLLCAEDARWQPVLEILILGFNSGGPVTTSLDALLMQLRDDAQSEVTRRIRGVAVRCVLPLGLCFLPAFIVLTIVPIVASFISQLAW